MLTCSLFTYAEQQLLDRFGQLTHDKYQRERKLTDSNGSELNPFFVAKVLQVYR